MPIVESLTFDDWSGRTKTVEFVRAIDDQSPRRFQTTVITGQNGSNKSTLLKELVNALALAGQLHLRVKLQTDAPGAVHVICFSGAVADRFPDKERGGRPTEFDVPNYAYLGQRVGKNLLSKKRPLETMLTSALEPSVIDRFKWNFFATAHRLAGISTTTLYEFQAARHRYDPSHLFDEVRALAEFSSAGSKGKSKPLSLSPATAQWLLEQFQEETFVELRRGLVGHQRFNMTMDADGSRCKFFSNEAIRLGLLTDILTLTRAEVESERSEAGFSAYDLSSGEYHMFTGILALGFGIQSSSVILIDEPENSLHPQWQKDFMDSVSGICENVLQDGHLIVCTHSPLIVAAAPAGSSVLDLSLDEPQVTSVPFGASSDELLLSQFSVGSSRNRVVVDAMQRAVSLVERGGFGTKEFIEMLPELKSIRAALRPNDPLSDVIEALVGDEKASS